jgi:hypothetical protein
VFYENDTTTEKARTQAIPTCIASTINADIKAANQDGPMMTGVGLAEDMQKGMIDRFRSLPMSRGAVLAGRTITEAIRNVLIMIMMTIAGYIMGFRIEHGVGNFHLG